MQPLTDVVQMRVVRCFAEFVDARTEPFHVHDVTTFGEVQGSVLGCLYGEYAM